MVHLFIEGVEKLIMEKVASKSEHKETVIRVGDRGLSSGEAERKGPIKFLSFLYGLKRGRKMVSPGEGRDLKKSSNI